MKSKMPSAPTVSGGSSPTAHGENSIDFDTEAPKCPLTGQRKQAADTDAFIRKPSIARANLAVSTSKPDGSLESHSRFKDYVSSPSSSLPQLLNPFTTPGLLRLADNI